MFRPLDVTAKATRLYPSKRPSLTRTGVAGWLLPAFSWKSR